jgi:hypothetical protein
MKFSSAPAYSIKGKPNPETITLEKLTPGPGTYNIRSEDIQVSSSVIFTDSKRQELFKVKDVPGPGQYNLNGSLFGSKSTSQLKSQTYQEKPEKPLIVQPGPGSYNPNPIRSVYSYSLGNKTYTLDKIDRNSLGPGSYSPREELGIKPKLATFSKSQRFKELKSQVPGPGTYDNSEQKEPATKFAMSARDNFKLGVSPGPGEYEISRDLGGVQMSFKTRKPLIKQNYVPGPGTYDIKEIKDSPGYKLGTSGRSKVELPVDTPGPGEYEAVISKNTVGKSFGKGERQNIFADSFTPGPGAYDPKQAKIGEGQKVAIQDRNIKHHINENPGPAYYHPKPEQVLINHSSLKFSRSPRWEKSGLPSFMGRNNNPGPGAYENPETSKKPSGWTFTKDLKHKTIEDDEPGPGHYNIPSTIPDVAKYLVPEKSSDKFIILE